MKHTKHTGGEYVPPFPVEFKAYCNIGAFRELLDKMKREDNKKFRDKYIKILTIKNRKVAISITEFQHG